MSNDVFANGRELACKAGAGKSIAAFPDVCMTPPLTPATPPGVPVPYPNTGMASDTTSGSTTVKISGKEVMLKNKSYFKKSTGDEAGAAPKKGVVSSVNRGKIYFVAWSMDVKIEGENAVRHLDMTTHNHGSACNAPPWAYVDSMADAGSLVATEACKKDVAKKEKACSGLATREDQCNDDDCRSAKKCLLVTKQQGDRKSSSTQVGCCDGDQPHHMIEGHGLTDSGGVTSNKFPNYEYDQAPCVCAEGDRWSAEHGSMHRKVGSKETAAVRAAGVKNTRNPDFAWNYKEAKAAAIMAHERTFAAGCTRECMKSQLDAYHNSIGCHDRTLLRTYDVEAAGHIK